MRRDTFAKALMWFNEATPFLPFTVELVNGIRIVPRHPEAVILQGDLAVFVDIDETVELFNALSVARLVSRAIPPGAE